MQKQTYLSNIPRLSQRSEQTMSVQSTRKVQFQASAPGRFVSSVISKGQPFTDDSFAPNVNSLLDTANKNGGLDSKYAEYWKKLVWRRASALYNGQHVLFKKGIEPTDIKQGNLADSYFLSALSALAEIPGRIESMFNTRQINKAGIYSITFHINGKPTEVWVDDYFPCDPFRERELPYFAYSP